MKTKYTARLRKNYKLIALKQSNNYKELKKWARTYDKDRDYEVEIIDLKTLNDFYCEIYDCKFNRLYHRFTSDYVLF